MTRFIAVHLNAEISTGKSHVTNQQYFLSSGLRILFFYFHKGFVMSFLSLALCVEETGGQQSGHSTNFLRLTGSKKFFLSFLSNAGDMLQKLFVLCVKSDDINQGITFSCLLFYKARD